MTHCKHLSNHNNHSLSTENNFTPNQLFIRGAIERNTVPVCSQPPTSGSSQIPRVSDSVVGRLLQYYSAYIISSFFFFFLA